MLGPIFVREFFTVPRRENHHLTRVAIVLFLWVLGVTIWQTSVGFERSAGLGETARFGLFFFQIAAFVILTFMLFFSALSASGTISQEKDRRTFILLLLTDMRDYEIVLGKMLGSLLPIGFYLFSTLPVLSMILLLGGISNTQVSQTMIVLIFTSVTSGSLGGLIALWREKTFQSLALSFICLVLYLCLIQIVPYVFGTILPYDFDFDQFLSCFDPFRCLLMILRPPATFSFFAHPSYLFAIVMLGFDIILNGIGILKLRKWNPSGEPIQQREAPEDAENPLLETLSPSDTEQKIQKEIEIRSKAHAAPGEIRQVWANPILWREIKTFAYGRRPLIIKLAYFAVIFFIGYFAINYFEQPGRPSFASAYGLVPISILSLLLVAAQSVTSITSERDGRCLDLLLATDLSPQEFLLGKLGGIIYNTKEFLLPPILIALYYACRGGLTLTPHDATFADTFSLNFWPLLCTIGSLVFLFAFAMTLGIHVSLRIDNSKLSIANTLGTIFFLSVGTLISIYIIVINGGSLGNQLISFSAFIALGIGGLWWVLSSVRPSSALNLASILTPMAMFYSVVNILIAKPGTQESTDPLVPFLVIAGAFSFAIMAMMKPLLSEFDVAFGRTRGPEE